jgi:hypothetical protein
VLAGARAAGAILLSGERRARPLLAAAVPVSSGCRSAGRSCSTARCRAAREPLAGLAIAALDLGVVGSRIPAVRALPQPRQLAEHVPYGLGCAPAGAAALSAAGT